MITNLVYFIFGVLFAVLIYSIAKDINNTVKLRNELDKIIEEKIKENDTKPEKSDRE